MWSEKVGCWWVSNRSGWLLELLTELKIEKYPETRVLPVVVVLATMAYTSLAVFLYHDASFNIVASL